jgi:hypothetical protein
MIHNESHFREPARAHFVFTSGLTLVFLLVLHDPSDQSLSKRKYFFKDVDNIDYAWNMEEPEPEG